MAGLTILAVFVGLNCGFGVLLMTPLCAPMRPALAAAGIAVLVFDGFFLANHAGSATLPSGTDSIALCLSNLIVFAAMTIAAIRAT